MSVLKFAHYKVLAQVHGVKLMPVIGLVGCYYADCNGHRVYLFSDEETIRFVNSL